MQKATGKAKTRSRYCLRHRHANRKPFGRKSRPGFLADFGSTSAGKGWLKNLAKRCGFGMASTPAGNRAGRSCRNLYLVPALACGKQGAVQPCLARPWNTTRWKFAQQPLYRQKVLCRQPGCGQAAGYAQDRMCRNVPFADKPFFFQHPCKLDTILVQPVRADVNR